MPRDKGSQHDTNVTPSPLVSSDNNSQLENTRLKEQSHIISRIIRYNLVKCIQRYQILVVLQLQQRRIIYDKTTENVHTNNNNLGSSESGKYDILMLHDSICREIDIQRLLRNSQRKGF